MQLIMQCIDKLERSLDIFADNHNGAAETIPFPPHPSGIATSSGLMASAEMFSRSKAHPQL